MDHGGYSYPARASLPLLVFLLLLHQLLDLALFPLRTPETAGTEDGTRVRQNSDTPTEERLVESETPGRGDQIENEEREVHEDVGQEVGVEPLYLLDPLPRLLVPGLLIHLYLLPHTSL